MKCWICGGDGTTGEHKIKRSDLRSLFPAPTQAKPLYFHEGEMRNRRIGSFDAKVLKSPSRICPNCNNALTQPHDRAWEQMSSSLRDRSPSISPGMIVRANRIFPYDTARQMCNLHLYFVKLFGCQIAESDTPIGLLEFSKAIRNNKPHPHIYLKFGRGPRIGQQMAAGGSDIRTEIKVRDGSCAFAAWFYYIGDVAVNVMFAADGEDRQGLVGAWHPRSGTSRLEIADFR